MNHLSRLLSILTILKSKRIVTGTELAEKFQVSLRTIYRDIRKLEDSGVPVLTIEGRGYSIMEGYTVAPIMFDEKEVNSLVMAEKLVSKTNDVSLIRDFNSTLTKIKSVFRGALQSQSEMLNRKIHIFKESTLEDKSNSLSAIQLAITNFQLLQIAYQAKDAKPTERLIEPLAIYSMEEKWIVIAWCRLRKDYRSFRLDRIKNFQILKENFDDRKFDMGEFFIRCAEIENRPLTLFDMNKR
ncbi:MAG: helix-turn-helix transcriptional regulator [Flavobacteriales bacterium]